MDNMSLHNTSTGIIGTHLDSYVAVTESFHFTDLHICTVTRSTS